MVEEAGRGGFATTCNPGAVQSTRGVGIEGEQHEGEVVEEPAEGRGSEKGVERTAGGREVGETAAGALLPIGGWCVRVSSTLAG